MITTLKMELAREKVLSFPRAVCSHSRPSPFSLWTDLFTLQSQVCCLSRAEKGQTRQHRLCQFRWLVWGCSPVIGVSLSAHTGTSDHGEPGCEKWCEDALWVNSCLLLQSRKLFVSWQDKQMNADTKYTDVIPSYFPFTSYLSFLLWCSFSF